jgi:hypothetical protein
MRTLVTSLLLVGCVSLPAVGFQSRAAATPSGNPALRACSILTKDMVAPFTANKQMLDLIPPEEEPMGQFGSACEYGVVRLQIRSVAAGSPRTAPGKEWQPVSGAGEAAYFRANGTEYAELMFWSGTHALTLQVGVPTGSTPDAIRPNTISLANAVLAKLR